MKLRKREPLNLGSFSVIPPAVFSSETFDMLVYDEVLCHINITAGSVITSIYITGSQNDVLFGPVYTPTGGVLGFQTPINPIGVFAIKLIEPLPRFCRLAIAPTSGIQAVTGTLYAELVKGAFAP